MVEQVGYFIQQFLAHIEKQEKVISKFKRFLKLKRRSYVFSRKFDNHIIGRFFMYCCTGDPSDCFFPNGGDLCWVIIPRPNVLYDNGYNNDLFKDDDDDRMNYNDYLECTGKLLLRVSESFANKLQDYRERRMKQLYGRKEGEEYEKLLIKENPEDIPPQYFLLQFLTHLEKHKKAIAKVKEALNRMMDDHYNMSKLENHIAKGWPRLNLMKINGSKEVFWNSKDAVNFDKYLEYYAGIIRITYYGEVWSHDGEREGDESGSIRYCDEYWEKAAKRDIRSIKRQAGIEVDSDEEKETSEQQE